VTDLRATVELAHAHIEDGRPQHAALLYRIVLKETDPPKTAMERVARGEACFFFAREAALKHNLGTAADWYRDGLIADPFAGEARADFAMRVLRKQGNVVAARAQAMQGIRLTPDCPTLWRALGAVEHEAGDAAACIAAYDKRLELEPDHPDAMLDRVTIALDTEDYGYARELLDRIVQTPRAADAWHCLAMIAYREGRHEEAIGLYDLAIGLGCHNPASARWNQSLALHSIGRWREGWAAHEARGDVMDSPGMTTPMRRFTVPLWSGQPGPARIHVHAEQGMGDNLCLARYLPLLVERGYDVRLETHEDLISLMQRSFPAVKVMARALDYPGAYGLPMFDYHIPMLSLPFVFGTEVDSVPWDGPYLIPDPEKVAGYRKVVPAGAVGLCWSSGIRSGIWMRRYGERKSMRLVDMVKGLHRGQSWVSLQVGPERNELRDFPGIDDVLPDHPTWDDTAALVACLDTVVTVDTAVSHLAGAMGKDVRLAMGMHSSFHYLADVEGAAWQHRSPWYPETRVYRQTRPDLWGDVVARIAGDLQVMEAA
jgi:Tfp pilus assembly protein PilF